jgi:nitrate reductase NapE component
MEPGVRQSYENAWFILLPLLFIRFIVVIILSVPFAGALCFLYLFFYSFFATVIYKPKGDSFYDLYSKISYHINHSKIDKPPRSCDGESLFSKLLRIIVNIVGVFKDNVLEILIIFICISFYNAIQTDMSDVEGIIPGFQMKECFTFLFFIFAIYGATKMYLKLIPEFKRIFIEGVED